jgi:hypothetical protein
MLRSCREGIVRQAGARQQLRAACSQRFEAAAAADYTPPSLSRQQRVVLSTAAKTLDCNSAAFPLNSAMFKLKLFTNKIRI